MCVWHKNDADIWICREWRDDWHLCVLPHIGHLLHVIVPLYSNLCCVRQASQTLTKWGFPPCRGCLMLPCFSKMSFYFALFPKMSHYDQYFYHRPILILIFMHVSLPSIPSLLQANLKLKKHKIKLSIYLRKLRC